MSRIKRRGTQGFTLVEAVIAVMIMSISIGACLLSFSLAMRIIGTAQYQMVAMHSARYELETLRTNSVANSTNMVAGTYSFANGTYGSGSYTVSNVNSATKIIIVNVPYINDVRYVTSTNTLTTCLVTTLHP